MEGDVFPLRLDSNCEAVESMDPRREGAREQGAERVGIGDFEWKPCGRDTSSFANFFGFRFMVRN